VPLENAPSFTAMPAHSILWPAAAPVARVRLVSWRIVR